MTATTAPAAVRTPAARPRPARWLLRLHRPALAVWTGLVILGAALLLWLAGPLTDAAAEGWRQYDACEWSEKCPYDQDAILRYKDVYNYLTLSLAALPLLVAAWAGAALTGRELESGTARLAWTQGVTPVRWLATGLALPAAAVTAGTSLLVFLHHRAWSAADGRVDTAKNWYDFWTFHTNGPTTVTLALAALAAGALTGLVLGRALPALAVSVAVTGGVWGLAQWLMPHLWPAVTRVTGLDHGYAAPYSGVEVAKGLVTRGGGHIPEPECYAATTEGCARQFREQDAVGWFHTYHPASHYWPLQLTTSAVLLFVAALATLAAFRSLRRLSGPPRTGRGAAA
ncbi:ABC transporter permease [Streptomyces sp. DSM 118148]|uniref:ABC transporter permease n=1 Tax=Streptomyces sp. DSM 118148 TaxID=3448667 RepID=UPI0040401323